MKSYFIKSFFVFDPELKHEKKKPNEVEQQEAKVLFYYPIEEDNYVKISNTGIIEGTYAVLDNFDPSEDILVSELDKHYWIAKRFDNLYVTFILEKTTIDSQDEILSQNLEEVKSIFSEFFAHFKRTFEFFNGLLSSHFCYSTKNCDDKSSHYLSTTDFLLKFQENTDLMQIFNYRHIPYMPLRENQYVNMLFSTECLMEENPFLEHCAIFYNGYMVHFDINLDELATLYNTMFNNTTVSPLFETFSVPEKRILTNINTDNQQEDEMRESNYNKCFKLEGKSGFLMGIKKVSINTYREFIPTVTLSDGRQFKLISYLYGKLLIFMFVDRKFDSSLNWTKLTGLEASIDKIFDKVNAVMGNLYLQRSYLEERYTYAYFNFVNKSLKITNTITESNTLTLICLKEMNALRENGYAVIKKAYGKTIFVQRNDNRCVVTLVEGDQLDYVIKRMKVLKEEVFDHVYI